MEKIVNESQSEDSTEFRNMVRLRHSNNADVRAAMELIDRFSQLPAKPNPGIKINVAAVQQFKSEKQVIQGELNQKKQED